ncbi:NAD(P)H-hydrate dehydratase [Pontivivens ytuae]|uniref:Bifunctional NAD(P)H-hydrate repair enzyme n=1 Tax=Pontivivens ytuae TaxID=2789856 RepID=A0A7S9LQ58_9RHOB|nr:NAD(P)H-hydrate dehydratase [Pontivivens ytuae]QPH53249.1 NAD(P)H-hydrate dehydratase [Pontivivens ytuae]
MTDLLTAAQMRALEKAAMDSGAVTGLELMERAGHGVVEAICEEWPELAASPGRAVVLCGPGNNGGDGFVVARLLKDRGWDVDVFLYGEVENLPPDAKVNAERWAKLGDVRASSAVTRDDLLDNYDLRIDAVFGTGLNRTLEGEALRFCSIVQGAAPDVCIDVLSGVCADSGRPLVPDPRLWVTGAEALVVTFQTAKVGHFLAPCSDRIRRLDVIDISLDDQVYPRGDREYVEVTPCLSWVRGFSKHNWEHKYAHGHALILSGGVGKGGAARLAARGALRIGAGLVTLAPPPAAVIESAVRLDAIMLKAVKDTDALREVLEDDRLNALCLGPGLGLDRARDLVPVALAADRATVLDADALTAFADDPATLFDLLHPNCVLTPHMGEFGRLFPDLKAQLDTPAKSGPAYSKVDAAREAAARAGCTVLLKGPDTVIADPTGRASLNASVYERAAPWLATAGAGDVLAGFITGLLARGFAPHDAAASAAWLHTECALDFGPGLIAEDLPERLPAVLARLANSP